MHVKKHASNSGWAYRKFLPQWARKLLGVSHINRYISDKDAPGKHAANAIAARLAAEDGRWLAHLKTLPEADQKAFVAAGGLKTLRKGLPVLEGVHAALADMRPETLARDDRYYEHLEGFTPRSPGERALLAFAMQNHAREIVAPKLALHRELVAKADGKPQVIGNGMNALFNLWVEKRGAAITAKHKHTIRRWIEINGGMDTPVKSITRAMVDAFYRANEKEGLGPAAQTKHRDHLKAMLQVACAEGWIDVNPAQHVTLSAVVKRATKGDDDDEGKSFSPAQLVTLLDAAAVEWKDDPNKLLALRMLIWTGARSNEICQLRCDQVETIGEIPCIRLRKGEGQSLKNPTSRRNVPLHKAIAADVLAHSGHGNGPWLFPSFPHGNPRKHNAALQAAFNGRWVDATDKEPAHYVGLLRGVVGITDPELTLHGTRHSFKDACRRARVDRETRNELMGHGKGSVHEEYGSEMLELMNDAIQDVDPLSSALKPRGTMAQAPQAAA